MSSPEGLLHTAVREAVDEEEAELTPEGAGNWLSLREQSLGQAERIIQGIPGYEALSTKDKIKALTAKLKELSDAGNHNRYTAERLAITINQLELQRQEESFLAQVSEK